MKLQIPAPLDADAAISECRIIGVRVIEDAPGVPTACAVLTRTGYEIRLGKGFRHAAVVWHELSHVLRGDCITLRDSRLAPQRANVAMDAIINCHIDMAALEAATGIQGVTLERLHAQYPEVPLYPWGWRPVYDALEETPNAQSEAPSCDADVDSAEAARTQAEVQARAEGRGLLRAGQSPPDTAAPPDPVLVVVLPVLRRAEHVLGAATGVPIRVRSWRRPGRVAGMRGHARARRKSVVVCCDVSGSMAAHYPVLLAAQKALSARYGVYTVLYADRVVWEGHGVPPKDCPVGGGTTVSPALAAAAARRPDVTLILTDGQHESNPMLPPGKRLWAIFGNPAWIAPGDGDDVVHVREGQ